MESSPVSLALNDVSMKIDEFVVAPIDNDVAVRTFEKLFPYGNGIYPWVKCFGLFAERQLIAFNSIGPRAIANVVQGHRLAVLPAYRGRGLGLKFDEWMGQLLHVSGYIYETEVDAVLLSSFERSARWVEQAPRKLRVFRFLPE